MTKEPKFEEISRIAKDSLLSPNLWWKQTVIYQIYPRSFYDTNGDGIGDIQGIIEKLDYLKKLGVETIWISPFLKSPQKDFGYDISDYYNIATEYGNLNQVEILIREVHQRGMKIVLDLVMNHTSNEHEWFKASQLNQDSKSDWYIWAKGTGRNGKKRPNNWRSMTGPKGWRYDEIRKEWYYASFLSFQPDLNYFNPEVKAEMFNMVRNWMDYGADGFRLDIFNAIYKDQSLKDNPFAFKLLPDEVNPSAYFQKPKYTINHPLNYTFAKELRTVIDSYRDDKERFLIGEVSGKHEMIRQYLGEHQDGLNLIFLFETLKFELTAPYFANIIQTFETHYPDPFMPVYVFSNHDRKRSISRIGNESEKAKMLAFVQLTVRGVPVIYYGEEIGMEQTFIPRKQALDPIAKVLGWLPDFIRKRVPENFNRDECRTPMQWSNEVNAGFCKDCLTTWLPINENYEQVNVKKQEVDETSLFNLYSALLKIRKTHPSLNSGKIILNDLINSDNEILAYTRTDVATNEKLLVVANLSDQVKKLPVNFKGTTLYSTQKECLISEKTIVMPKWSGIIIKIIEN